MGQLDVVLTDGAYHDREWIRVALEHAHLRIVHPEKYRKVLERLWGPEAAAKVLARKRGIR